MNIFRFYSTNIEGNCAERRNQEIGYCVALLISYQDK